MGNLMENLRAKYELYRLEQRYTKRQNRTTFISGAQYIDGEYVYNTNPVSPPSKSPSSSTKSNQSDSSWAGKRLPNVKVAEIFSTSGVKKRVSRVF